MKHRDPARCKVLENRRAAWKMRVGGMQQQEIADKLGLSQQRVSELLKEAFAEAQAINKEEAARYRLHELELCDMAIEGLLPQVKEGDTKAITAMIAVLARRSKYLGLDVVQTQEHKMIHTTNVDELRTQLLDLCKNTTIDVAVINEDDETKKIEDGTNEPANKSDGTKAPTI